MTGIETGLQINRPTDQYRPANCAHDPVHGNLAVPGISGSYNETGSDFSGRVFDPAEQPGR